jgi:hypothetical protein
MHNFWWFDRLHIATHRLFSSLSLYCTRFNSIQLVRSRRFFLPRFLRILIILPSLSPFGEHTINHYYFYCYLQRSSSMTMNITIRDDWRPKKLNKFLLFFDLYIYAYLYVYSKMKLIFQLKLFKCIESLFFFIFWIF